MTTLLSALRRSKSITIGMLLLCVAVLAACNSRDKPSSSQPAPAADAAGSASASVKTIQLRNIDLQINHNDAASRIIKERGIAGFCEHVRSEGPADDAAGKNALGLCYFFNAQSQDEYVAGEKLIWEAAAAGGQDAIANKQILLAAYKAAKISTLGEEMKGVPPSQTGEPSALPAAQWFAANINKSACNPSESPAVKIRSLQEAGFAAKTKDFGDPNHPNKVQVSYEHGDFVTTFTFYRTSTQCEAELPRSQQVPAKYE